MLKHLLTDQDHLVTHAHGWVLGEEHLHPLLKRLESELRETTADGVIVILDFTGITSVTASYLKATLLWLLEAGRLSAEDHPLAARTTRAGRRNPWPMAVYPMVTGISEEIAEELVEVLSGQKCVCLDVIEERQDVITKAKLLGPLDRLLLWTMDALSREGAATAAQLHERYQADNLDAHKTISSSGWSNRLADLYGLRLVRRWKLGKQFVYEPIAKEVFRG